MIEFGTDGWRAVLGNGIDDFSDNNVSRVTLAIANYVSATFGMEKPILIGYDPRYKADEYAKMCADILSNAGFQIYLSSKIVPTPVLAYNTLIKNACAIMFTASHNPPEYLGMKFIPDYAGPATSEVTDGILKYLDSDVCHHPQKAIVYSDFSVKYNEHIEKIVDFEKIKTLKSKVIFDGLYSASIGYFDSLLKKHDINFQTLHMQHDPNFGGLMPDPKPKYLGDLINAVKASQEPAIGLANDGDADRFGVVSENGNYIPADIIIGILLRYLVKKGYKGALVKTVGSSIILDIIAKKLGINVIETAVGFKHVGEAMRENQVIIGGEESGGLSILGHIPEKDGLIANLLVLEAIADSEKTLTELVDDFYNFAGCKFYSDRIDIKKSNRNEISNIIQYFKGLESIGKYKITARNLTDGVKLMLGANAKILVRPSGTEPLLRIYFESDSEEKLNELIELIKKILEEKFT